MPSYVIVGASLAGAKAAETLRDEGFDGDIVLIGAETERPYERPPLSKGYLLGRTSGTRSSCTPPAGTPSTTSTCARASPSPRSTRRAHRATTGRRAAELSYDKLLLATGASPRRLDFPGSDRDGGALPAHARRLRPARVRRSSRAPGSWSSGPAGSAWRPPRPPARPSATVTVVEPQSGALHRPLGPELGAVFADLHRAHGVEFRFGETGASSSAAGMVITSGGAEIPADVAGRRHRRGPQRRPGRRRRPGDRQRRPDRRGAAHLRPGHLRRRRRRQLPSTRCSAGGSASSTGPTP